MKDRYPTPDTPGGEIGITTRCVPIPDMPEFIALIGGLLFQATQEHFWDGVGTMSPEEATVLMQNALGLYDAESNCGAYMTCEQIIDCIENDTDVHDALMQYLLDSGFAPGGNAGSPTDITLTAQQTAENLLPADYNCNDGQAMATARQVIREFNELTEDFFESVELITNTAELGVITTDGLPVVDTLNNIADFIDWAIQTMREQYQASYSQEVEDILSCSVYCAIMDDCELTLDELIGIFADYADPDVEFPDTSSFQAIADWALSLTLTLGVGTVATWFWILTQAMRFGSGTIFEIAGMTDLRSIIAMSIGWNDTSYTECDECPPEEEPTTYWYMDNQFQIGQQGWIVDSPYTAYQNGGFESIQSTGGTWAQIAKTFGSTTLYLAGIRVTALRRGSIGNGSYDYTQLIKFPNENQGGTPVVQATFNFLTCNTNNCSNQKLDYVDNTVDFKSLRIIEAVDGNFESGVNMCRIIRVEVWGFNHADYKPANSVWVETIE